MGRDPYDLLEQGSLHRTYKYSFLFVPYDATVGNCHNDNEVCNSCCCRACTDEDDLLVLLIWNTFDYIAYAIDVTVTAALMKVIEETEYFYTNHHYRK
jgi:hypothetical protein